MKEFNKCYLYNNKYVIINYTSSKSIVYEKEKRLDKIFNMGYYDCNLDNIVLVVRSILGIQNENTFRVTIVYHDDITDLVYFSKGKIIKYAKKVSFKDSYFDMLYTTKKGLNIKTTSRDSDLGKDVSKEIIKMNNLELIEGISLSNNDLILYEIYKLFYQKKPNYFENNDRIRTHIMMYILREYGVTFEEEDFTCKEFPKSLLVEKIMYKLMISNSISEVKIREDYKKIITSIGNALMDCDIEELITLSKYMYISKYRDSDYSDDKANRLIKKINRSMEVI